MPFKWSFLNIMSSTVLFLYRVYSGLSQLDAHMWESEHGRSDAEFLGESWIFVRKCPVTTVVKVITLLPCEHRGILCCCQIPLLVFIPSIQWIIQHSSNNTFSAYMSQGEKKKVRMALWFLFQDNWLIRYHENTSKRMLIMTFERNSHY